MSTESKSINKLTDNELSAVFAKEVAGIGEQFLMVNRGLYYRPGAKGYTNKIEEAGRYPKEEADRHAYPHDEPVYAIPAPTPNFSTSLEALLPWVEELSDLTIIKIDRRWLVQLVGIIESDSLPRALCEALVAWKRGKAK